MALEYDVAMAWFGGEALRENDWTDYIERQRVLLQAYAEDGWELESTVPITIGKDGINTLGGVLFYFSTRKSD